MEDASSKEGTLLAAVDPVWYLAQQTHDIKAMSCQPTFYSCVMLA